MSDEDFTWRDGERTIRFGRGALADAPSLLGDGYVLLSTARGLEAAPALGERAAVTVMVAEGRVDDLAGDLLPDVPAGPALVALGGGRVVDVAKAIAAARDPQAVVAAVPTTLSAAEMTWVHRHARGVDAATPRVRPRLVLNDPALSASQPDPGLSASAANALGHAIEGAVTALASPVPTLAAIDAARRLAAALPAEGEPDRDGLALGALLSGYAIDANWYGLHHVMSQTLVREAGAGHGPANAALLPTTTAALRRRLPHALERLDAALGEPAEAVARRFAERAGVPRLRDLGLDESVLDACAEAAAARAELALTPPPAGPRELGELYREAW
ncbi:MAG: iron-containing alcohol dehydrogenase [Solirubrobacteraceae bacterium]|jgi:alcohol dehydrogenase class IV|nr:iron-containing alcohol dehydrogenase [Solirubrobacteraceae bacterium]